MLIWGPRYSSDVGLGAKKFIRCWFGSQEIHQMLVWGPRNLSDVGLGAMVIVTHKVGGHRIEKVGNH